MSRDPAIGLLGRTALPSGMVRQVAMPPGARALSTLSPIDYEDAFLIDTGRLGTGRASSGPERSWKTLR